MQNSSESHDRSARFTGALPRLGLAALMFATPWVAFRSAQAGEVGSALQADTWWAIGSTLGLGLVFGLKHALDADHVAAVSAIVSERSGLWRSSLVGALWGLGHTAALLVAGVAVIGLEIEIGPKLTGFLELAVAAMLIGLGLNALRLVWKGGRLHVHRHNHGDHVHVHPHVHAREETTLPLHHGGRMAVRPFLVGVVHGLAGSAAVMLLVLASIRKSWLAFAYLSAFGLGSVGGMVLMSALVGLPLHWTAQRYDRAHDALRILAGLGSVACGLFLAYDIGVVQGLFT